ncbi:MAG: mftF, partial [Pseudonocardiales bacterium]|nr:mftF [Pseudonocardiales bacterium]
RYASAFGSLDLGGRAARVVPSTRVAYVPSAALLVRRAALIEVSGGADVFDATLRYGEDVDLVWRLHGAGWRVRYDPSVQVRHHEPDNWPGLLQRRFHYGTSAAPLSVRHPTAMAPLVLQPWLAATVAALLARRPGVAVACGIAAVSAMIGTLRRAGVPASSAIEATLTGVRQTWLGIGRYATQFTAPVLVAALVSRRPARRRGRRAAVASLLFGPPLTEWVGRRPALDPAQFVAARIADDVAYGAGVLTGALRGRTVVPIRPVVSWRRPHPIERPIPHG